MFNVGSGEFLIIALIALVVLGPDKLPNAARQVGKVMADLRKMSSGFQQEMRQAMDVDGLKANPGPTLPPLAEPSADPAPTAAPTEIAASNLRPTDPAAEPKPASGPRPLHSEPTSGPAAVERPSAGEQGAA